MGVGGQGVIKEILAFSAKVSKFTSRDFFYRALIQMDKAMLIQHSLDKHKATFEQTQRRNKGVKAGK